VGANTRRITLETPYGRLVIPKKDIQRIDYEGEAKAPDKATGKKETGSGKRKPLLPPPKPGRPVVSFEIRGTLFWYAFDSPPGDPVDLSIRLRLYVGEIEAATLVDSKPDTVDKNSYYNSFDFSAKGSRIVRRGEGFECRLDEAEKGRAVLVLELPAKHREGQHLVRMLYQINEGSEGLPRWIDVVSRSFPIQVEAGKESYIILEQDAARLDYSGFFRKSMKNVESFQVRVLSSELRELQAEPLR
jgi:hypothetical protein